MCTSRTMIACAALAGLLLGAPAAAQVRTRVPADLLVRAAERGSVRVLVELEAPTRPEAQLSGPLARWLQRRRIAAAQQSLEAELASTGHHFVRHFRTIPFAALEAGPDALAALAAAPGVRAVQEDRLHWPTLDTSVPLIEALAPRTRGLDGAGQAVVVIDTGVDLAHPNFAGKLVAEACFAAGSPFGSGDCPNGQTTDLGPGAGAPCSFDSGCFHGTHVAGIAVGAGSAFSGVATGAGLIPIQVFSRFTGVDCGTGGGACALSYSSDQVAALDYVFSTLSGTHDIASVNMSLGGAVFTSQALCDASNAATKSVIDNLRSIGIPTVIAAGNDGFFDAIGEPGCISSAVSVGATDDADAIASFSNAASFLSLWAPGVSIRAPLFNSTGFTNASGTSMAAPHVAGTFAVLRQAAKAATVDAMLSALQTTGLPIPDVEANTSRIRVDPAVSQLLPDCRDGIDNDGDGLIDWDGGDGDPTGGAAGDPDCFGAPNRASELPGGGGRCGLGPELLLCAPLLLALARRRRMAA